ncbi:MAG: peptidase T [Pyrinomonadaceae bacterium]|nr:peptidase T [Sphingobacteriaceae bacterium]
MKSLDNYSFTVLENFIRYVKVNTQSNPNSTTCPSTSQQKKLSQILVDDLKAIGIKDAEMDDWGYVYATIPSNTNKNVPVICFCSHVDTSPDCSGENVNPILHSNYQGQDIILPDDTSQIIKMSDHPDLQFQLGNDIVTASGTTLLGADNKAGVAEIVEAAKFLMLHPEIKHGAIRILFTPDEEIGRGVDKVDLTKLGADFAYTIDGETAGSIENETFSAKSAILIIKGVSAHPGFAKSKMESAIKIASEIITHLPKTRLSPESTQGKEGFIHPVSISGSIEEASIEFILRDFDQAELKNHEKVLLEISQKVLKEYPKSNFTLEVKEQYRNMKAILDSHPDTIRYAQMAIERAGLKPILQSIRGGTDGCRLSFMGLPCPNIFAGEHAFHGKQEWVSVQDMQKAVETIIYLAMIWEEKS